MTKFDRILSMAQILLLCITSAFVLLSLKLANATTFTETFDEIETDTADTGVGENSIYQTIRQEGTLDPGVIDSHLSNHTDIVSITVDGETSSADSLPSNVTTSLLPHLSQVKTSTLKELLTAPNGVLIQVDTGLKSFHPQGFINNRDTVRVTVVNTNRDRTSKQYVHKALFHIFTSYSN